MEVLYGGLYERAHIIRYFPPLIYQVENDPGETFPLDPTSDEYVRARGTIEAAVVVHKATVKPVPNMMALVQAIHATCQRCFCLWVCF